MDFVFQIETVENFHFEPFVLSFLYCIYLTQYNFCLPSSGKICSSASADSPATAIVTFLWPAFRKGLCLIIILKDVLCTLELVGHKICRPCTKLCRLRRHTFFYDCFSVSTDHLFVHTSCFFLVPFVFFVHVAFTVSVLKSLRMCKK